MLKQLQIENYALIAKLDVHFSNNFSVITGETGAGKSILLGALGLILGKRADVQSLQNKDRKCIIEGVFKIDEYQLNSFFERYDLDYEDETTLRREISPNGKTRAFINDTPVNLTQLKELGSSLIDVHSQHESLLLNTVEFKFSILDSYAGNVGIVNEYQEHYAQLKEGKKALEDLLEQQKQSKLDTDYFQFQLNELMEANIQIDEQERIESELKVLSNAEAIKEKLYQASLSIGGEESSVIDKLRSITAELNSIREFSSELEEIAKRLDSAFIEIGDLSAEIENLQESVVYDAAKIQLLNDKLNLIYSLQQKHQVKSNEELLVIQQQLENKLQGIILIDESITTAENKVKSLEIKISKLGTIISQTRRQAAPKLQAEILELLYMVKMPNSSLEIKIEPSEVPNQYGLDAIQLSFSANKGGALQDLSKVASGGELSRLMLCIKAMTSKHKALPTIIFDEIDTGVSGEVADKMGVIMRKMGEKMQVISITHLPQIAGKGHNHFYVYKDEKGGITNSNIKKLNDNERVDELAKMLSGAEKTDAAVENAKELLKQ
ncbi:MAG: DNA repair protein RecN [Flavobacteriales bacterium]|nr:DNA repair protein RecN [Flavobacteriales bacterium]